MADKRRSPPFHRKENTRSEKQGEKIKMDSSTCKVKFVGQKNPLQGWGSWVSNMCSAHQTTWKNAGIYEAIMSSTYTFKRDQRLILELASRWCSVNNTFVFPWGEATLTLEDMLILGGFSALGVSTLTSIENDAETLEIKDRLENERLEIQRSTAAKNPLQSKWMEKFVGCGNDLEHAAFLSMWLSRFVFPIRARDCCIISKHVIPIAARLSKGIKIALGPTVLAMLYKDLTALKNKLRETQLTGFNLCVRFHLVQIWAWERFPMLKPVRNCTSFGENIPRLARWSNVMILKGVSYKSAIDSAKKDFLWCPYGRSLDSFGKCVRTLELTELVGFDSCVERYSPQRVARQFGLDQEIPSHNFSTSSQVKDLNVENKVDCGLSGFSPGTEVMIVSDSESDSDSDVRMTELLNLPFFETGSRKRVSSSNVSSDHVEDACFMDETEESARAKKHRGLPLKNTQIEMEDSVQRQTEDDGKNNDEQSVQQQHSNSVSPPSDNESNKAMKVDIGVDCGPSGFSHRIEVIDLVDSDSASDDDCSGGKRFPTSIGSPDVAIEDACLVVKTEDCDGILPNGFASRAKVVHISESDEEDDISNDHPSSGNELVHETNTKHDVVEGTDNRSTDLPRARTSFPLNEPTINSDDGRNTNRRSTDSGFDLEARISRLEHIVNAAMNALEATR